MIVRPLEVHVESLALLASRSFEAPVAFLDGNDGSSRGRYSFLGLDPVERRTLRTADVVPFFDALAEGPRADGTLDGTEDGLPLARLPRWIGAIAYDLVWAGPRHFDVRSDPRHVRSAIPLAHFDRFEALAVADQRTGKVVLVGTDAAGIDRFEAMIERARRAPAASAMIEDLHAADEAQHRRAIERALEYIADGDHYQINLARRFTARVRGRNPARALARAMRTASPVPFGALLELPGDLSLIARTMETFLSLHEGHLVTRPIKGTRRHGADSLDAVADALRADPKERAEHAMIVDLMRNDLARVAVPGSVEVDRPFTIEPYAKLSHMVSTVVATHDPKRSVGEVLLGTFPPGSVTGTPKSRAIERIEELEPYARGFYTGAIGAFDHGGGFDLAVAIRVAQLEGERVSYFAGGGIVEASQLDREVDETVVKALAFTEACSALGGSLWRQD